MIDEDLRKRMTDAYDAGDYDLALTLSQELDEQIAEEQTCRVLEWLKQKGKI